MPDRHDPLASTLERLRSEVERAPLAPAAAVRGRGNRRSRRQAVGGALALIALVGGAAVLGGGGTRDRASTPVLPAGAGPTATSPPQPVLSLAPDPFLRGEDLGRVGPYGAFRRAPADGTPDFWTCLSRSAVAGSGTARAMTYYEQLEATVAERVLAFATAGEAADAATAIGEGLASCPPGDPTQATVTDRGPEPLSDTALRASRSTVPTADAGTSYVEVGVARRANVLVVLQWSSMGRPDGLDWVWDAGRLQTALDRATAAR